VQREAREALDRDTSIWDGVKIPLIAGTKYKEILRNLLKR